MACGRRTTRTRARIRAPAPKTMRPSGAPPEPIRRERAQRHRQIASVRRRAGPRRRSTVASRFAREEPRRARRHPAPSRPSAGRRWRRRRRRADGEPAAIGTTPTPSVVHGHVSVGIEHPVRRQGDPADRHRGVAASAAPHTRRQPGSGPRRSAVITCGTPVGWSRREDRPARSRRRHVRRRTRCARSPTTPRRTPVPFGRVRVHLDATCPRTSSSFAVPANTT